MTQKAGRKIYIEWKRSGIGFTRRQRASIRGLGLRRLHHVVEREDTPQVRGLVAAVPHLVEIVKEPPKPAPWAAVPAYTVHPAPAAAEEATAKRRAEPLEERVVTAEGMEPVAEPKTPTAKPPKAPKAGKAPAAASKAKKAVKGPAKKKPAAAEKSTKAKTSKGKK